MASLYNQFIRHVFITEDSIVLSQPTSKTLTIAKHYIDNFTFRFIVPAKPYTNGTN